MDNPLLLIKTAFGKIARLMKKKKIPIPSLFDVLLFFAGILCGRATLFGVLRPFGGAFFAAVLHGRYTYIYMVSAILGQVFSASPLYETGKYIFAMCLYALIAEKLPSSSKDKTVIRSSLFTASLALSGLCFIFASSKGIAFTTAYDLMLLFLECAVAFCGAAAFCTAIPVIKKARLSFSFTQREEISLAAFFGCVLWGGKDIAQLGFINLSEVACIFLVLVFAVRLGSSHGVIAGSVMGLVSALGSGRFDISCVSYTLGALAASVAGVYGALPASSAFILSNALVTALANGSTEVLINLYDIFAACLLYSITPERWLMKISAFGSRDEKSLVSLDERHYCEYVLKNARSALTTLDKRMNALEETRSTKGDAGERFLERVARKGCMGCGLRRVCWSRDFNKTSLLLTRALTESLETGKLKSDMLPVNCLRPKEFREAFTNSAEIYRIEKMWHGRLQELSHASKSRMEAFSEIISVALNSLSASYSFDRALSEDIERRLREAEITPTSVTVMRDEDNDPVVMLRLKNCGGFSLCDKGVNDIVSSACGVEMLRTGRRDCALCEVKYVPKTSFEVSFATSGRACGSKNTSGDSVRWRIINKSLYAAVLCDGMGTGHKAALEARTAADTLLDLIEAGIDGEASVRLVNSLFLPYGEATFSATDLYLYNSREKTVKIIKCGAVASFTKSGGRVDALYSKSMPLGSVLKPDLETFTLPASSGDITVMISDGVLDTTGENALKDTWLIDCLDNFSGDNPHILADSIVERAMEKCKKSPRDDITVLAAIIK